MGCASRLSSLSLISSCRQAHRELNTKAASESSPPRLRSSSPYHSSSLARLLVSPLLGLARLARLARLLVAPHTQLLVALSSDSSPLLNAGRTATSSHGAAPRRRAAPRSRSSRAQLLVAPPQRRPQLLVALSSPCHSSMPAHSHTTATSSRGVAPQWRVPPHRCAAPSHRSPATSLPRLLLIAAPPPPRRASFCSLRPPLLASPPSLHGTRTCRFVAVVVVFVFCFFVFVPSLTTPRHATT